MTDQMHMEQYVVGMVATNCYLIYHTQTKEALLIDPGAEAQRLMDEMARLRGTINYEVACGFGMRLDKVYV